jgi:hypothetical protein
MADAELRNGPDLNPTGTVEARRPLDLVSLAISGFDGGVEMRPVLRDWFEFLGGRPGEVIYVDGGSRLSSARRLAGMVQDGMIDRLELLNPRHWENSFDRCYIQEYRAGFLATRPYILFVKLDMLPWRRGHDGWLAEDLAALDRPGVFALTNTHLLDPPTGVEGPYQAHDFASLNFTLMKREAFHAATREQIGDLIDSNFRGPYPEHLQADERWRRALIEWAWQAHIRRHGLRTLAREESADWTIFHINKKGRKLLEYRRAYRARRGIDPCLNKPHALYRPPLRAWQRWGRGVEGVLRGLRSKGAGASRA